MVIKMASDEKKTEFIYHEVKKSKKLIEWEKEYPPKYWEYRKKWEENPKKRIVGDFPIHLDLESTRKCNLRCPMCPRTIKLERGELEEGDMDFRLYKKVIDEGSENGLYSVKLNLLGEPLCCKDLPKMIKYAKKKRIIDVMINTNGVLLTEDMSKKLIDAGLDKLFISFDSPTKKIYESIRIGAKFENVLENVKTLVKIRDENNLRYPITRVSMVLMKENKNELPKFIKLWAPIVDIVAYEDYIDYNVDYGTPQLMDKESRRTTRLLGRPDFLCSQLYQRLAVLYNGKIGLCCEDYDAECELGDAWVDSIKKVWTGKKLQMIRGLHARGQWYKVPRCKKCPEPYMQQTIWDVSKDL